MGRIGPKIGDLVEVRRLEFVAAPYLAPDLAISGYHFSDITADLMTKWIAAAGSVSAGQGKATALAGFRGSGKSHFLAALAGLLAKPELRSKIGDIHVRTEAEGLARRKWSIAVVHRGSAGDLLTELRDALALMLAVPVNSLPENTAALLLSAFEQCGHQPFAVFIDTDAERESAVARQDGAFLAEIGEAAKAIGIFAAVALDDDIAGADGSNVSIASNYSIDYLEQEHLFKIIDTDLFVKTRGAASAIQSIYKRIQAISRRFRWSEQRFSLLYPLHPIVAEAAPFVRLYLRDFALLRFAEEAAEKDLDRSSDLLIGPDKLFDAVETAGRAIAEMGRMFEGYDRLAAEIPPSDELQARLLKALFILSLEGRPVPVDDIAASLLLDAAGTDQVLGLLNRWVDAGNGDLKRDPLASGDQGYRFGKGGSDTLIQIEGADKVDDNDIWRLLIQHSAEKFSDLRAFDEVPSATPCAIEWRGGIRRGMVHWGPEWPPEKPHPDRPADWTVLVSAAAGAGEADAINWRVARLTDEERESLGRLHLIRTDAKLRERIGERLAVEGHRLAVALDAAWQRTFIAEAAFACGGEQVALPSSLVEAHNLAQVMSIGLAPILDTKYPDHPVFPEVLHQSEAATLISEFLASGGDGPASDALQRSAEIFAVPLGLASHDDGKVELLSAELLKKAVAVQIAVPTTIFDGGGTVGLDEVAMRFRESTMGLSTDAQHIVLGALVARRVIDLVTSENNRITYRSLDLQIIWDDVVGIAPSIADEYSEAKRESWSKALLGDKLGNIPGKSSTEQLHKMLADWGAEQLLLIFHSLPSDAFSASLWRRVVNVEKKFQHVHRIVADATAGRQTLEEALGLIIALFADTPSNYEGFRKEIDILRVEIANAEKRFMTANSLHLFEPTCDGATEQRRAALIALLGRPVTTDMSEHVDGEWVGLRESYAAFYAEKHAAARTATMSAVWPEKVADVLMRSSETEVDQAERWHLERALRTSVCGASITEMLPDGRFCACQTSLATLETIGACQDGWTE